MVLIYRGYPGCEKGVICEPSGISAVEGCECGVQVGGIRGKGDIVGDCQGVIHRQGPADGEGDVGAASGSISGCTRRLKGDGSVTAERDKVLYCSEGIGAEVR